MKPEGAVTYSQPSGADVVPRWNTTPLRSGDNPDQWYLNALARKHFQQHRAALILGLVHIFWKMSLALGAIGIFILAVRKVFQ